MMKYCCGSSLKYLCIVLLAGCWMNSAGAENWQIAEGRETSDSSQPRLASFIHSYDLFDPKAPSKPLRPNQPSAVATTPDDKYWSFPSEEANETEASGPVLHLPAVVRLPPPDSEADPLQTIEDTANHQPVASLLPPQAIVAPPTSVDKNFLDIESLLATKPQEPEEVADEGRSASKLSMEEQEMVDAVIRDSRAATTGVLTDTRVNELAKTKIRRAYAMAGRGAYYAARQELIEVLRMISQNKDAHQGESKHILALAAGLRALEEAVDFAPRGTQLEADLVIDVICASHRTPVTRQLKSTELLPRQMMDCYFRYAQLKLATAVKGEPAGSMALHALGKLTSRLNQVEPEKLRLAHRRAVAYQQAALLAHNQNHLAAHELAVLLADSGHYAEAEQLLIQVVSREPNAVVYRNLARVQEKLGQIRQATANLDYAQHLIRQGAGGQSNVQWVSPQNFARSGGHSTRFATTMPHPQAPHPATSPARPPQQFPGQNTNWR